MTDRRGAKHLSENSRATALGLHRTSEARHHSGGECKCTLPAPLWPRAFEFLVPERRIPGSLSAFFLWAADLEHAQLTLTPRQHTRASHSTPQATRSVREDARAPEAHISVAADGTATIPQAVLTRTKQSDQRTCQWAVEQFAHLMGALTIEAPSVTSQLSHGV